VSWVTVAAKNKPSKAVAIISYDEKPGIQAIATTAQDLPPEPGVHATFARDHEYKRLVGLVGEVAAGAGSGVTSFERASFTDGSGGACAASDACI
jgi:hypothetical protein